MVRHGLRAQARQQHGFNVRFDRQGRIDQRNFVDLVRLVDRFGLLRQRQRRRHRKKRDAEIGRLNPGSPLTLALGACANRRARVERPLAPEEESPMPSGKTVTGKLFEYSGSLATGVVVHFEKSTLKIPSRIISIVRNEIETRSPVLMGANRKPLVANSIGETLAQHHRVSPQVMSYVLPLLIEEGFCSVSSGKPFVIYRNRT